MEANVVHRRDRATNVGYADYALPHGELAGFVFGRQVTPAADSNKLTHDYESGICRDHGFCKLTQAFGCRFRRDIALRAA